MKTEFEKLYSSITGYSPFPWQTSLYSQLCKGTFPQICTIPTGLGKTMVIPIWLLALAAHPEILPRRMVYVVNRRTIVDQATDLVSVLREKLIEAMGNKNSPLYNIANNLKCMNSLHIENESPIAVSTLRGEFADNGEWKSNPAKPSIIIGTVDMIGSKLLFSGYGDSRRTRALHAGLLGFDTFFIHDEAHLTPAFGKLLRSIHSIQSKPREESDRWSLNKRMKIMELSATHKGDHQPSVPSIGLSISDEENKIVKKRLNAIKTMYLHEVSKDGKPLLDKIIELANNHWGTTTRVVIFVKSPQNAQKIAKLLVKCFMQNEENRLNDLNGVSLKNKEKEALELKVSKRISLLTGQIRGFERDQLLDRVGMKPFLQESPFEQAYFLVATSAAEVGMDLHADHMVSDLSTLDSMIQRLGRVNRFGKGEARVDVVFEKEIPPKNKEIFETSNFLKSQLKFENTVVDVNSLETPDENQEITKNIQSIDASLNSIGVWLKENVKDSLSATPEMVDLTKILLDLWSYSSVENMPARPTPEAWLHGIQEDYPHTRFAWRYEVEQISNLNPIDIQRWFRYLPLRAAECLQLPTFTLLKTGKDRKSTILKPFSEEHGALPVIIFNPDGNLKVTTIIDLVSSPRSLKLEYSTILLPTTVGGLDESGFLEAKIPKINNIDVSTYSDGTIDRFIIFRRGEKWSFTILGKEDEGITDKNQQEWETLSSAITKVERYSKKKVVMKLQIQVSDEFTEDEDIIEKWILLLKENKKRTIKKTNSLTVTDHNKDTLNVLNSLCSSLDLPEKIEKALQLAAKHHDIGKSADIWQFAAGHNPEEQSEKMAKGLVNWRKLEGYRHEVGSLVSALKIDDIMKNNEKDLILHLISSHHGWARPHFKRDAFHSAIEDKKIKEIALNTMLRFEHLQNRFGWWTLAWLESILKRADAIASSRELLEMEEES